MKIGAFPQNGVWLKGNIHGHSTVSDGRLSPTELIQGYMSRGYDFISMTDHNVMVPHSEVPADQLLLLTGTEHDINHGPDKCLHAVGLAKADKETTDYPCRRYTENEITDQQLLDMMTSDGQFVVIAHPLWSRMEPEELLSLTNFNAIEVYNYGTVRLGRTGQAELYWDLLLQRGKKVFAIATDDQHFPEDLYGGWITVKAKERSAAAILQAMFSGEFYASTGPEIYDFSVEDGKAYISCSPCREVHFVTYPSRGTSSFAEAGVPLREASCALCGQETYVRAVCVDGHGYCAWTNPIYLK